MKRPFLHLAIFLIIGLLSGQYTDFLPYTALLAVLIIGFRAFKNKNIVFLLILAIIKLEILFQEVLYVRTYQPPGISESADSK